jgi:hypothetical protein
VVWKRLLIQSAKEEQTVHLYEMTDSRKWIIVNFIVGIASMSSLPESVQITLIRLQLLLQLVTLFYIVCSQGFWEF